MTADAGQPDDLTGMLGEIARIAGPAAARALHRAYAGRRVYVPAQPDRQPGGAWVALVGLAAARALAEARGGEYIHIPMGTGGVEAAGRRRRRALIETLDADGRSAAEIAAAVGCSIRSIYRWRARRSP